MRFSMFCYVDAERFSQISEYKWLQEIHYSKIKFESERDQIKRPDISEIFLPWKFSKRLYTKRMYKH